MNYREKPEASKGFKQSYADGFENLIQKLQNEARESRARYIGDIFENAEKYREDFKKMLGYPLTEMRPDAVTPKCEKIADEKDFFVYRMSFEILEGLNMTGLFFKLKHKKKAPLAIVQHGGGGTPELVSGIYGDTANYNDMLERVLCRGVHVFAPQLLLWNEKYDVSYDRRAIDARLKRVGSSIAAVEIYGIMRILDFFETKDFVTSFGMVGLSYGGFYTLYTAAADTRIRSAISCAFFNTRDTVSWSDWTWQNSAMLFDDAEVAALIFPRRLCVEIANHDELFDCRFGKSSFERLKEICGDKLSDRFELIVFDGVHEFCRDDAPLDRLVADLTE